MYLFINNIEKYHIEYRLNKKKKREAKRNEKVEKLNKFEENSFGDLFMASTPKEISNQILKLKVSLLFQMFNFLKCNLIN